MSFATTQEWRSELLRAPGLVRQDIFVQSLTPDELGMVREALERGLTPSGITVAGNTLVIRFDLREG